jgi:hypothetical protein
MPTDPLATVGIVASGLKVTAWLWKNIGDRITDTAFRTIMDKWDESRWHKATEEYRAKVQKLYGTMQIMGMTEPVPLDDIFTDAYLLDKPTAFGRFDIDHLKKKSAETDAPLHAERINGLRLAVEKGNLFILGKPGAGKTTFLKYLTLKAAEQIIDKVPIFVGLKQWSDSELTLLDFICERFDVCDFPFAKPFVEELLRSGQAMVLFDGLDEVNQESGQRDRQTGAMNNFIEKYDRTQCLITCRIAASDYSFKPFTYVELADFTEGQIKIFVGNWFRADGERDTETCAKFFAAFEKSDNQGLRDLARTPLLLTLLCLAFNETLTFPQRRVEIYQEALDALLKKWDSSRRIRRDEVYRKLSVGHKENLLAQIAHETFTANKYFIPQRELEKQITDFVRNVPPHDTNEETDGETILKVMESQHGIFVERARAIYSFSHLTFQEYFTARYTVDNAANGTLQELLPHCIDPRWREVFVLTTSMLPDASGFIIDFRRSVDHLLGSDVVFHQLFSWADRKAGESLGDRALRREVYLSIAKIAHRDSDLSSDRLDLGFALFHDRALDHSRARAIARDTDLTLDLAFDRDLDLACDRDLYRDRDLDRSLARARVYDLALALKFSDLTQNLQKLLGPSKNASSEEWESYSESLRALMIKSRDIGHLWELNVEQKAKLSHYIGANRLLIDCLELATMPPDKKKAVEEGLFLPVGQFANLI